MTINIKNDPSLPAGRLGISGSGGGMRASKTSSGLNIVTSGLSAYLDASNAASYPGSGTTIYDLSGQGADGTMNGTVSWVSSGQASYWSFTQGDSNDISSSVTADYKDFTIVMEPDFSINSYWVGLIARSRANGYGDRSLRFYGGNSPGPWYIPNPGNNGDWCYQTSSTLYKNGVSTTSNLTISSGWNILGGGRTNLTDFTSPFPYNLGTSGYPGRNFQGKIAVALLYNRVLTQEEQLQNYNELRGRFGL